MDKKQTLNELNGFKKVVVKFVKDMNQPETKKLTAIQNELLAAEDLSDLLFITYNKLHDFINVNIEDYAQFIDELRYIENDLRDADAVKDTLHLVRYHKELTIRDFTLLKMAGYYINKSGRVKWDKDRATEKWALYRLNK